MKIIWVLVFLCVFAFDLNCEPYFTGELKNRLITEVQTKAVQKSALNDQGEILLTLGSEEGNYVFELNSRLRYSSAKESIDFKITEYFLLLELLDYFSIKVGQFHYLPGMAEFFSNTNFYSSTDFVSLLEGDLQNFLIPNTLMQFKFFLDQWYFNINMAPLPLALFLPEPDSVWFPKKHIPRSITLFTTTLYLEEIILENPSFISSLSNLNWGVEVGGGFSYFDVSLSYFQGQNNFPLLRSTFDMPNGLTGNYNIRLEPVVEKLNVLALNFKTTFEQWALWTDSAFYFKKPYSSNKLDSENLEKSIYSTAINHSPALSYTCGLSYEFFHPHLSIKLEYKDEYIFENEKSIIESDLSSLIVGNLSVFLFEDKLIIYPLGLLSIEDLSWALVFNLSFIPEYFFDCFISMPLFYGGEGTEFGQYSENRFLSIGFTFRY